MTRANTHQALKLGWETHRITRASEEVWLDPLDWHPDGDPDQTPDELVLLTGDFRKFPPFHPTQPPSDEDMDALGSIAF